MEETAAAVTSAIEALPAHEARVGDDMRVFRALPTKLRRRIGAWCFLDHYGPVTLAAGARGMRVGPHPHIGLQTVSWLFTGEVLHRDSLGSLQTIRPGQLNLMTSGRGISHSEETPSAHPPDLHGLQFWIALPDGVRQGAAVFDHYSELPSLQRNGYQATVVIGTALGERSPARVHSPLAGVDLVLIDTGTRHLPLNPEFEHALMLIEGDASIEGQPMVPATLYYLGGGRNRVRLGNQARARVFLLGGEPLGEEILMWWNFVARNQEELAAARADWQTHGARFGEVRGYDGERLEPPELAGHLKPD